MDIKNIDLRSLNVPIEDALAFYEVQLGLRFQNFPDLTLTPDKPNSARTIIPVTYQSAPVGDFYAIVFARGDGTGDSKTYKIGDLKIPSEFQHAKKQERVIPRAKTELLCEGCFPLFSLNRKGHASRFAMCLDELGVGYDEHHDRTITRIGRLGQANYDYANALYKELSFEPRIQLTMNALADETRLGDPHTIYFNRFTEESLQVAGFLAIKDPTNPFLPVLQKQETFRVELN